MREAIAADGEAQRALLAGESAREPLRRAANAYRASWEAAPPRSFGRLVGYAKASILAGENPGPYVREQLHGESRTQGTRPTGHSVSSDVPSGTPSPAASWALALGALADSDDDAALSAADGMLAGSEAFGRAAGAVAALARRDRQAYAGMLAAIVADFEARDDHLTGVPIADTALVLERLAERRGLAAHPRSPLLPEVDDVRAILTGTRVWAVVGHRRSASTPSSRPFCASIRAAPPRPAARKGSAITRSRPSTNSPPTAIPRRSVRFTLMASAMRTDCRGISRTGRCSPRTLA